MNNIIAEIQGNFGNVLFQLAHAITYASKSNRKLYIKYGDKKSEITFGKSEFLKSLNIPIWTNCFEDRDIFIRENKDHIFEELRTDYSNTNVYIKGYFESEMYFETNLIRELFDFNKLINTQLIQKYQIDTNSIALSVRRGDILNLKNLYFVPSKEYYNSVINTLSTNNEKLIVSSDDINWCKQNIEYKNCIYLEESPEINLALLSLCKNHINSSSTFSWWSTWINEEIDSINIFPYKRFVRETIYKNDIKLYLPSRWIKYKDNIKFYE